MAYRVLLRQPVEADMPVGRLVGQATLQHLRPFIAVFQPEGGQPSFYVCVPVDPPDQDGCYLMFRIDVGQLVTASNDRGSFERVSVLRAEYRYVRLLTNEEFVGFSG